MKNIAAAAALLISLQGNAQVVVSQVPPSPVSFTISDFWDITIVNNGDSREIVLQGKLNDSRGNTLLDAVSQPVLIERSANHISKNLVNVAETHYSNAPITEIIRQNNNLPFGEYNLCIYVLDKETRESLSESCLSHTAQPATPPILVYPPYCIEVPTKNPVFTWLAPTPIIQGQEVLYDFKLVEVQEGQSYEDAIQRNIAIASAANLKETTFLYPGSSAPLDSLKTYAWQVQAKVKKNNGNEYESDPNAYHFIGISEVWCLKHKLPQLPEIKTEKKYITYAYPKLYEDAEINVYGILYMAYREDYTEGALNYTVKDENGKDISINMPLQVKKGENRYDINLKQTGLFYNKKIYKLVIKNNNRETYYLRFRYFD